MTSRDQEFDLEPVLLNCSHVLTVRLHLITRLVLLPIAPPGCSAAGWMTQVGLMSLRPMMTPLDKSSSLQKHHWRRSQIECSTREQ